MKSKQPIRWTAMSLSGIAWCLAFVLLLSLVSRTDAETSVELIKQLQGAFAGDTSTQSAAKALRELNKSNDVSLNQALTAMNGATPLGRNWLMGLASSLYRKNGSSKTEELTKFLFDVKQDSEARYLVFQWLTSGDEALKGKILKRLTQDDPSLELRYIAIEFELQDNTLDAKALQTLLDVARHPEQMVSIINRLREKEISVDQSRQFGFLTDWKLLGPFDHVGTTNFDKVFPVESDWVKGATKSSYEGKNGPVKWLDEKTQSPEGLVDLAALYSNEKGCIIYAVTEFDSEKEQDAELRLGCINGNKIWVNGKLVMTNEVYHTSMQIDQYAEPVHLKAGKNQILVKVCQNEQKEQWAQRYAFQLRVSDSTGKAILAKGR